MNKWKCNAFLNFLKSITVVPNISKILIDFAKLHLRKIIPINTPFNASWRDPFSYFLMSRKWHYTVIFICMKLIEETEHILGFWGHLQYTFILCSFFSFQDFLFDSSLYFLSCYWYFLFVQTCSSGFL